ncbi:MAG TPA: hypothetical protein VHR47_11755 [Bacillota bacterium]|nr:hypothetical protein [Bacillota bacterium]
MKNSVLLVMLVVICIGCLLFSPGNLWEGIVESLFVLTILLILVDTIHSVAQVSPEKPLHFDFLLRAPPISVNY